MAATSPPRRSARARKTNTLFQDQVPWADAAALLRAPSNSPDRSSESSAPESIQRVEDNDDFDTKVVEAADEDEDENDENADANTVQDSSDDTDADADANPVPTSTPSNYAAMFKAGVKRYSSSKAASKPIVFPRPKEKEWSKARGLRNRRLHQDKERLRGPIKTALMDNFGPELEDLFPVIRARDIWYTNVRDLVLPSKASIREALALEAQGKYLYLGSDNPNPKNRHLLSQSTARLGQSRSISFSEAVKHLYCDTSSRNEAVLGPWNQSRKVELEIHDPVNISTFYRSATASTQSMSSTKPEHHGWLINLGARIQCLAWAQSSSEVQYLAVAFKSTKRQRQASDAINSESSPAFSQTPSFPSHVQILKVEAITSSVLQPAYLSHELGAGPCLQQILCMRFGSMKHLEWLPLPSTADPGSAERALVLLSSDGNVRIVSVNTSQEGCQEILTPDRIARSAPDTIFTCFCLPSHTDLLIGDSAGAVHLFNICQSAEDGSMTSYATYQIHSTYVMALTVATDYPHFICSQSAAGEMILSDLRSPNQDRVAVHKARLPTRNLVYYPFTRMFITTTDSAGNSEATGSSLGLVVGHNLRHFYQTQWLLKLPECSGVTTAFTASPFHPITLVANAAGMVFASNILKRLLPVGWKSDDNRVQSWVVKLCEVDWVELPNASSAATNGEERTANMSGEYVKEQIDVFHGRDARPGIMRFHEGFQPTRVEVSNSATRSASGRTPKSVTAQREATSQIILPEEQGVTAMAWNPNSRFSGWAAIAWGNGVLCIKDLSHDVAA